jgi:hypothetical protein
MIRHGVPPYLECSSAGDQRFSAFFARIRARRRWTIERIYQGAKKFRGDGDEIITGLSPREAKGFRPLNGPEVRALYAQLWDEYIAENPDLIPVLVSATGLSDRFGKAGGVCQATELWRIRNAAIEAQIGVKVFD